jgi:hypothetical protein
MSQPIEAPLLPAVGIAREGSTHFSGNKSMSNRVMAQEIVG